MSKLNFKLVAMWPAPNGLVERFWNAVSGKPALAVLDRAFNVSSKLKEPDRLFSKLMDFDDTHDIEKLSPRTMKERDGFFEEIKVCEASNNRLLHSQIQVVASEDSRALYIKLTPTLLKKLKDSPDFKECFDSSRLIVTDRNCDDFFVKIMPEGKMQFVIKAFVPSNGTDLVTTTLKSLLSQKSAPHFIEGSSLETAFHTFKDVPLGALIYDPEWPLTPQERTLFKAKFGVTGEDCKSLYNDDDTPFMVRVSEGKDNRYVATHLPETANVGDMVVAYDAKRQPLEFKVIGFRDDKEGKKIAILGDPDTKLGPTAGDYGLIAMVALGGVADMRSHILHNQPKTLSSERAQLRAELGAKGERLAPLEGEVDVRLFSDFATSVASSVYNLTAFGIVDTTPIQPLLDVANAATVTLFNGALDVCKDVLDVGAQAVTYAQNAGGHAQSLAAQLLGAAAPVAAALPFAVLKGGTGSTLVAAFGAMAQIVSAQQGGTTTEAPITSELPTQDPFVTAFEPIQGALTNLLYGVLNCLASPQAAQSIGLQASDNATAVCDFTNDLNVTNCSEKLSNPTYLPNLTPGDLSSMLATMMGVFESHGQSTLFINILLEGVLATSGSVLGVPGQYNVDTCYANLEKIPAIRQDLGRELTADEFKGLLGEGVVPTRPTTTTTTTTTTATTTRKTDSESSTHSNNTAIYTGVGVGAGLFCIAVGAVVVYAIRGESESVVPLDTPKRVFYQFFAREEEDFFNKRVSASANASVPHTLNSSMVAGAPPPPDLNVSDISSAPLQPEADQSQAFYQRTDLNLDTSTEAPLDATHNDLWLKQSNIAKDYLLKLLARRVSDDGYGTLDSTRYYDVMNTTHLKTNAQWLQLIRNNLQYLSFMTDATHDDLFDRYLHRRASPQSQGILLTHFFMSLHDHELHNPSVSLAEWEGEPDLRPKIPFYKNEQLQGNYDYKVLGTDGSNIDVTARTLLEYVGILSPDQSVSYSMPTYYDFFSILRTKIQSEAFKHMEQPRGDNPRDHAMWSLRNMFYTSNSLENSQYLELLNKFLGTSEKPAKWAPDSGRELFDYFMVDLFKAFAAGQITRKQIQANAQLQIDVKGIIKPPTAGALKRQANAQLQIDVKGIIKPPTAGALKRQGGRDIPADHAVIQVDEDPTAAADKEPRSNGPSRSQGSRSAVLNPVDITGGIPSDSPHELVNASGLDTAAAPHLTFITDKVSQVAQEPDSEKEDRKRRLRLNKVEPLSHPSRLLKPVEDTSGSGNQTQDRDVSQLGVRGGVLPTTRVPLPPSGRPLRAAMERPHPPGEARTTRKSGIRDETTAADRPLQEQRRLKELQEAELKLQQERQEAELKRQQEEQDAALKVAATRAARAQKQELANQPQGWGDNAGGIQMRRLDIVPGNADARKSPPVVLSDGSHDSDGLVEEVFV